MPASQAGDASAILATRSIKDKTMSMATLLRIFCHKKDKDAFAWIRWLKSDIDPRCFASPEPGMERMCTMAGHVEIPWPTHQWQRMTEHVMVPHFGDSMVGTDDGVVVFAHDGTQYSFYTGYTDVMEHPQKCAYVRSIRAGIIRSSKH